MVEDRGRWFADAHGRPAYARGTLRVESGLAGSDPPTASFKARATMLAQIMDDVAEAQRSRHALTLVVGAIEAGEQEVQAVMAEMARRIRPMMRRRDRFMAYARNRFAVALASCPAAEAEAAMQRLFTLLQAEPDAAAPVVHGLRLGAASAPDHAVDAPELLRRAELALATTTRRAAACVAMYRAGTARTRLPSAEGASACALIDALNDRRLVLASWPAIDAQTQDPVFLQALLRLRLKNGRIAMAGDPGRAAERTGLATLVDARLLELTADHLAAHPAERMSFPVSAPTLQDSDWLTMLAAHLGARPGIASRLIVELPETALDNEPAMRGRLDAMKALGVGIALTGFGTGHASLKHLRSLPVDMLKIDGVFVQALSRSTDDRFFVRSLIDLAQHFGIATIAEWVEDDAVARLLGGWGVDYLQGPICGAPILAGERPVTKKYSAGVA
jgi:EAL domain-containing protein (putative c-di-GMP-specific phosphodiesterase class I)/GGDEF domain-containing protein